MGDSSGSAGLVLVLAAYLLIFSTCTAYVCQESTYGIYLSDMILPIDTNSDFTNPDFNITGLDYKVIYGIWNFTEYGLMSAYDGRNWIEFNRIDQGADVERVYSNTYHIYNPDALEYSVLVRSSGFISDSFDIEVTSDELTLRDNNLEILFGYRERLAYSMPSDNYYLTTVYDEDNDSLKVYVNDALIWSVEDMPNDSLFSFIPPRYGGIMVFEPGFYLQSFSADIDRVVSGGDDDISLFSFLGILSSLIFWTLPEAVFPLWMNLVFVKAPALTLFFIGVQLIRG